MTGFGDPAQEQGFTLLEVLVALAVLAVGAVSLLGATQTHAARIAAIEARTIARWVANDQLTALRLGLEPARALVAMNRNWEAVIARSPTTDPDLQRVDITIVQAVDGRTMYQLTGFIDTAAAGGVRQ